MFSFFSRAHARTGLSVVTKNITPFQLTEIFWNNELSNFNRRFLATYYGNRGRWEGDYWVMDTDKDTPSGDPNEKCGDTSYYQIHKNRIVSNTVSGFCLNLPGNPPGHTVTTNDSLYKDQIQKQAKKSVNTSVDNTSANNSGLGGSKSENKDVYDNWTCVGYSTIPGSWPTWEGAQLWRRVYQWSQERFSGTNLCRAFPTYKIEGNRHEILLIKNPHLKFTRYRDVGGHPNHTLLEGSNRQYRVQHDSLDLFFQKVDSIPRTDGITAALPSLHIMGSGCGNATTEITCLSSQHTFWHDVKSGDLGDPNRSNHTDFINRVMLFGKRYNQGGEKAIGAYPTMHEATYPGTGRVFGVNFIRESASTAIEHVYDSELPAATLSL